MENVFIFFHSEVLWRPRTFFERNHPGYLILFTMRNPRIFSNFDYVLKPEAVMRAYQNS